jgi:sodium transport system permease protein
MSNPNPFHQERSETSAVDFIRDSGLLQSHREAAVPFSWHQQFQFILKELRETLRDRRTIVTLLLMPLLLYPLLGIGLRFVGFEQLQRQGPKINLIGENEQDLNLLLGILLAGKQRAESLGLADPAFQLPDFFLMEDPDSSLEQQVQRSFDLGVRIRPLKEGRSPGPFGPIKVEFLVNADSLASRDMAESLENLLREAERQALEQWGERSDPDFALPLELSRTSVPTPPQPSPILGLLPLILLLMTVTGGVYPAIDLTAGERERNTLETLMALPVPRFRLLLAKYIAVVTVTLLTGLMNLLAMGVTLYALQLDKILLGESGFGWALGARLFTVLFVFALFYSALLLLLTSSARSFKEAQAYLIPLLLVSIAPGLLILFPGWNLQPTTAVIPVVNVLLLSREFMEGTTQFLPAAIALLSTLLYGLAALGLAARVFGNDAVSNGASRWSELFQGPGVARPQVTLELALFGLALLFPLYFLASGLLGNPAWGFSPAGRLWGSACLTILLFAGIPWLLMRWQGVAIDQGFRWSRFTPVGVLGGVLLGIASWPWVFEIVIAGQQLGWGGLTEKLSQDGQVRQQVARLLAGWKEIPVWMIVVALGIVPGICEELFFRGFLFRGLQTRFRPWITIGLTAILFGVFHVILAGGVAIERVLPSTLMGLLLGWVAYRSGSVLPGMLLHVLHNSTLLWLVSYREQILTPALGELAGEHLPLNWLIASGLVILLGLALVGWSGPVGPEKAFRGTGFSRDRDFKG